MGYITAEEPPYHVQVWEYPPQGFDPDVWHKLWDIQPQTVTPTISVFKTILNYQC